MAVPTGQSAYPHETAGPQILGATLTVTIVALITMVVRLYVRVKMIRNVGWDDYIMIAAMLLCIAGQLVIIPEVRYGGGKHIDQIDPNDFQQAFKLNFVTQPIYLWAICLVKLSIGAFLLRVAVIPVYRRIILSVMVFMGIYTLGCFLTIVLQCTNLAVQWDRSVQGTCWGPTTLKALSYTNSSLNILTDLLFAVFIPIPMLWSVQMNSRQKMSIIGILGLGVFATAAALVKVYYLTNYGKTGDWLWDSRNITIWTVTECCVGIIAGNLPCMKPLFRRVLGSTYGRGSKRTTGATPRYLSKPYGPGTGHGLSVKNYNSLASGRTEETGRSPYGASEAHMMTSIGKSKDPSRSQSRNSSRDQSPGKSSTESVTWLNEQSHGKMGEITKTTEVNVTSTVDRNAEREDYEDGVKRKEVHMV